MNLPNLWDEAREKFEEHKQLLCGFGNKTVSYGELVAKVRGRDEEELEVRNSFDIARAMESAVPPDEDEGLEE